MLHFIAIGMLIPLVAMFYLRRTQKAERFYAGKYKNPYLEKYFEADSDSSPVEQYKVLGQAAAYLLNYEETLEEESKVVSQLFYMRMIGNLLWTDLKTAKEEIEFEKLSIEAELGRFAKIAKSIEVPKVEKKTVLVDVYPEDNSDLKRALYKRCMEKRANE
ncbi:hypothetical protein NEHOM01_1722 [Nematocida homosporus]|uniref:uncharacterized protein n=1 Tax=Nematocida homosporus TaxID=1912981 RepID=UPI002220AE48|nr:uncharacterized protein NEHOM01_1722 [Nematocida homosporus]KAI5186821.1 hypothetical protein NEHOM01_1722 [Nematocida homosporus]